MILYIKRSPLDRHHDLFFLIVLFINATMTANRRRKYVNDLQGSLETGKYFKRLLFKAGTLVLSASLTGIVLNNIQK